MKITYNIPFTQIKNEIIQSDTLSIYQKMVYIVLCSHAGNNNSCFPSYATIAREVGCSRRKVIDTIFELENMGHIIVHRDNDKGKRKSNDYEIVVDNSKTDEQDSPNSACPAPTDGESSAPGGECGAPELYTDNNINSFNNNQSTISEILENAELENFYKEEDRLLYKTVLEKMYNSKAITVDGEVISQNMVCKQLEKVDYEVICEADNRIKYTAVSNKVGYLISVIYNQLKLKPCTNPVKGYQLNFERREAV